MVIIVRSSTDDNLVSRTNCGTAQVPTTIEAASVGFSIAYLLRYGWTFSKKVAYYAQHLICTDTIYTVPAEEFRATGSLSLNVEHSFVSNEESREAHFAKLEASPSSSGASSVAPFDAFGRQFEVIHGGSAFLRAVEDVWDMGEQILSSLSTRLLDLDQSDMDSTDVFFTFLDLFILAYYNGTNSNCEDARKAVLEDMGKFYDIRQRLRTLPSPSSPRGIGSNDTDTDRKSYSALVEKMLESAQRVRMGIMYIARYEARKGAVIMRESSPMWENGISGKAALLMLARGMSVDEDDDKIIFKDLVHNSPDIPNLEQVLGRCNDIRRLADAFSRAEEEYIEMFSSSNATETETANATDS